MQTNSCHKCLRKCRRTTAKNNASTLPLCKNIKLHATSQIQKGEWTTNKKKKKKINMTTQKNSINGVRKSMRLKVLSSGRWGETTADRWSEIFASTICCQQRCGYDFKCLSTCLYIPIWLSVFTIDSKTKLEVENNIRNNLKNISEVEVS